MDGAPEVLDEWERAKERIATRVLELQTMGAEYDPNYGRKQKRRKKVR